MTEPKNLSGFLLEKTKQIKLSEIAKGTGISDAFLSKLRAGAYASVGIESAINLSLYLNEPLEKILKLAGKEQYYKKMKRLLAKEFRTDPVIQLGVPDGEFEGIKCLDSPICLGPGYNVDDAQIVGHMPIHKSELPIGYKSEPDRVVCFPTAGLSMVPTIMPDSHVVIDRYVPAEWVVPGALYAFLMKDGSVTIKRLLKITDHSIIIDADNTDPRERQPGGSAADFPMILPLQEDHSVVRGRVIWILNRLVPKE